MKTLLVVLLVGFVLMLWYLANIFSKPVLNRMSNYYEDDHEGRTIANILIGVCISLAAWIGYLMS
jgi:hypothetical protein